MTFKSYFLYFIFQIFLISIHPHVNSRVEDYSHKFHPHPTFSPIDATETVKLQFQSPPGTADDYISLRYPNYIKFVIILISMSCENNQYRLCSSLNVGIFGKLEENEIYLNNDKVRFSFLFYNSSLSN